jgi:demethylmenaquinone methyltransferase/2-methoxy-6-polyprenyl-1,4-benzoquinol methylase
MSLQACHGQASGLPSAFPEAPLVTIGCEPMQPVEKEDSRLMRQMFGVIAPKYDFITKVFSYGMDGRWKRKGVQLASLPERPVVLDLACGTGDFSKLVSETRPKAISIAADLTHNMLRLARSSGVEHSVCADAMTLPFPDHSFDCVFIGYGLRNFPHLDKALLEIDRVTRPGGTLVSLDFFLPSNPILRRIYLGYLFLNGVFWGTLLHGRPRVYTYIPDSLRSFVSMDEYASRLRRLGYSRIDARSFIFGGIGLHCAVK